MAGTTRDLRRYRHMIAPLRLSEEPSVAVQAGSLWALEVQVTDGLLPQDRPRSTPTSAAPISAIPQQAPYPKSTNHRLPPTPRCYRLAGRPCSLRHPAINSPLAAGRPPNEPGPVAGSLPPAASTTTPGNPIPRPPPRPIPPALPTKQTASIHSPTNTGSPVRSCGRGL